MHRYRTIFSYARPSRRQLALALGLSLVLPVVVALQPWPLKLVVDYVLGTRPAPGWLEGLLGAMQAPGARLRWAAWMALAGFLLTILQVALESALAWTWTRLGRRMVCDLAEAMFRRLQRASPVQSRHTIGDLMNRLATDAWCGWFALDHLMAAPLQALLTSLAALALMLRLDPALTAACAAVAPLMLTASLLATRGLGDAARARRESEGRLMAHVQQTLAALPVVQAFVQEERERARFEEFADDALRAHQRSTLLTGLNQLASGLALTAGVGVVLWLGAQRVLAGTLSLGSLLVFVAYLGTLQTQLKALAGVPAAWQTFRAGADRVLELLERPPDIREAPHAPPLPPVRGHMVFEKVTFAYQPGRLALDGISLEISPGQTVAIVGASGAGKTTLVNLVPRFLDPQQGRVLLDGHDVRAVSLASLRAQVAFVFQESFILNGTVAENIALGRPAASIEEIQAAAREARAHDFIERLPQGYSTMLGGRATALSGGERQRLALARAFLRQAPVLILDEPTSALDEPTGAEIVAALGRLRQGRTTLLIAHRLSTVTCADQVVVLDAGRIVEAGPPAELLRRGRFYARLYNIQFEREADTPPGATATRGGAI